MWHVTTMWIPYSGAEDRSSVITKLQKIPTKFPGGLKWSYES